MNVMCRGCNKEIEIPPELIGTRIECSLCKKRFTVTHKSDAKHRAKVAILLQRQKERDEAAALRRQRICEAAAAVEQHDENQLLRQAERGVLRDEDADPQAATMMAMARKINSLWACIIGMAVVWVISLIVLFDRTKPREMSTAEVVGKFRVLDSNGVTRFELNPEIGALLVADEWGRGRVGIHALSTMTGMALIDNSGRVRVMQAITSDGPVFVTFDENNQQSWASTESIIWNELLGAIKKSSIEAP